MRLAHHNLSSSSPLVRRRLFCWSSSRPQESLSPTDIAEADILSRVARICCHSSELRSTLSRVLAVLLVILLGARPLSAAEDEPASPQSGTLQTTESFGVSDPVEIDLAEEAARESFNTFTIAWMRRLTKIDRHQEQITETDGSFSVEYLKYLPTRFTVVKKTKSAETPFVGILTYYQRKFHSSGSTKEEALQGPFEELRTKQVSEIFRYTKGNWVY